jgi:hypothetical protein
MFGQQLFMWGKLTLLVLVFVLTSCSIVGAQTCGNSVCEYGETIEACPGDCEFIFTYWPNYIDISTEELASFADMRDAGMTHAGITFRPTTGAEGNLSLLEGLGYRLALEISPGHYSWGSPLKELIYGDDDSKYLDAPCLNKTLCDNWNFSHAIDPTYTGVLWQNTLANTLNVTSRANADVVLYDIEIWATPETLESYYRYGDPGRDCYCYVVRDGIGYEAYYDAWMQRGLELTDVIKQVNQSTEVFFYHEWPGGGNRCSPSYTGLCTPAPLGVILNGTGDAPCPSIYTAANLEALEKSLEWSDFTNALPWVSYTYMLGYSNFGGGPIYFDPSVSREAGRMLRKAGARGFFVYPNAYNERDKFNGAGYDYWLDHAREMIIGFKEGLDYVERNKLRNPDFEAFKAVSTYYTKIDGVPIINGTQFAPNFWSWTDSNAAYSDNVTYANLSRDEVSGTFSWEHMRFGNIGNRSIKPDMFSVELNESGDYAFSIWTKSSIDSVNGRTEFYLLDMEDMIEHKLGEVYFSDAWEEFTASIELKPGDYELKVLIMDDTGQPVSVWLDNSSLILMQFRDTSPVPCTMNQDCEDFDDCSADRCVQGYCQFTKFEDQGDCYYCADFNNCTQYRKIDICGGADIDHNGSVEQEDFDILIWWFTNRSVCNPLNFFCNYSDIDRSRVFRRSCCGTSVTDLIIIKSNLNNTCNLEPWRACELGMGSEEVPDGFDNDCDGEIDEGDTHCGNGVVEPGEQCDDTNITETCSSLGYDSGTIGCHNNCTFDTYGCAGTCEPSTETCNDVDDDCDGDVDEGGVCCGNDRIDDDEQCDGDDITHTCASLGYDSGSVSCTNNCALDLSGCIGDGGACQPSPEICNGLDDDCDDLADDGLVCDCLVGESKACGSNIGACEQGTMLCVNGRWGSCNGGKRPTIELCDNGLDDDCDGGVDIDCTTMGQATCVDGAIPAEGCFCGDTFHSDGFCYNRAYTLEASTPPWMVLTIVGAIILLVLLIVIIYAKFYKKGRDVSLYEMEKELR